VLHHLEAVAGTPWILVVVFAVASLDAVLPFMPSETTLVAVAIGTAAVGHPNLLVLIVVAATGAYTGDQIAYLLGRHADGRVTARLDRHHRGHMARLWAGQLMTSRGGLVIVVARYLPGGRSVTAFTAGLVRYPAARFGWYTGLAVLLWATQAALLGYWGGVAFAGHPMLGVAVASTATVLAAAIASAIHRAIVHRVTAHRHPVGPHRD
jgi:membrane-associated protein